MPTSNFLQMNPTEANQENDATYLAEPLRAGGIPVDSIVPSAFLNKVLYQASTMVAAFANFMLGQGISASDASLSTLATNILAAINVAINAIVTPAIATVNATIAALSSSVAASLAVLTTAVTQARTVQQFYSAAMGGDFGPLTANVPSIILTQSVTFPAAGGPFRVLVSYNLYLHISVTHVSNVAAWVTDSINTMASAQVWSSGAIGPGLDDGINASEMSAASYTNGTTITFSLTVETGDTSVVVKQAPSVGAGNNSQMVVTVVPD